jgi:hypothetical protein
MAVRILRYTLIIELMVEEEAEREVVIDAEAVEVCDDAPSKERQEAPSKELNDAPSKKRDGEGCEYFNLLLDVGDI